MKYAVVTFGCRVNQADSLALEGELLARGATAVPPEAADLVVVNTCSVTAAADQGARQTIRRIARDNPSARIVATGCYATRQPDDLLGLPGVTAHVANPDKPRLLDLLQVPVVGRHPEQDGAGPCGATLVPGAAGRTAFTLGVQTGCDEVCSYCIIPRTRGSGRSRPLADVMATVAAAVAAGYREIVLTGVHLGSYGRDLLDGTTLTALLQRLDERDWGGEVLFRISSLEPMDCTPALVDLVASSPRFASSLHLPLQHASDAILRAMRRPYDQARYREVVALARARMPHASIGTDVIVGFPGETDAEADTLLAFLEDSPLTSVHVFPYSDRPGADSTGLAGKVDGATVRARARRLREVGASLAGRFEAAQTGTVRRALVVHDGTQAVTDNYLKVRLDRRAERNQWVYVRVEGGGRGSIVEAVG